MANDLQQWQPPQEKTVKFWTTAGIGVVAFAAAVFAIHTFVPTISSALVLLQVLTQNVMWLAIDVGFLAVVGFILWETFSPDGGTRKLVGQAYSSFIHNMTLELLNVDPMSPLKDSLAAVQKKKVYYDQQFAVFDGQISKINQSIENYTEKARHAEIQAKAALTSGPNNSRDEQALNNAPYDRGSAQETANNLTKMRDRLMTVRGVIVRLQQAANDIIHRLQIDIDSTQVQWDTAQSMTGMERAARGIISSGGKDDLAREAQQIVNTKYAVAIGKLENLNDAAMPLLQSMDMDKAVYKQDLFDKWQAEASATAIPVQAQIVQPAIAAPASGGFASLIK